MTLVSDTWTLAGLNVNARSVLSPVKQSTMKILGQIHLRLRTTLLVNSAKMILPAVNATSEVCLSVPKPDLWIGL